LRQFQSVREIATIAMILGGLTLVYSLPKLFLAARLFFRNGTLERSLKQVTHVLLQSLNHCGLLQKHPGEYLVEIEPSIRGNHNIILHHATRAEERIFLDALAEILGPVDNPRYLMVRQSWFGARKRQDYHAVPAVLGTSKEQVQYFHHCWTKLVGPAQPVFTRQKAGRKLLLKARAQSMASGFQRFVDRRSQWR
jgi:hypothetical protein